MPEPLLFEQLTAREYEVLTLMAAGRSNREIADKLVVALSTAKWFVRQIYNKMGVENRRQAIVRARAAGLLNGDAAVTSHPNHNLPAQTTPFIGRQTELADLNRLLGEAEHRLLTILGPGGMGKSRLGLAVAEGQLPHFANGVYFVPLAPLTDPANLIMTIAEHSGYQLQSGQREPRQQLLDYFREKHMLLVLDNFEHLLDGVGLVSDILQVAPGVKVMATSRELLGLYGETTYSLSGMLLMTSDDDALQLFAESARRTQPDFTLDDGNLSDVTRICQLVGGLPLGIELSAAWLRTLTLSEIADELGQGLDILETRTHSLRAVFDRSWRLMTDKQQQAFVRLSVFRGGCTRTAAEAVTGVNLRVLQNLVDKSLLWRTPRGRFEMHELLRQYAAEKLDASGEGNSILSSHMNYFADMLEQRAAFIDGTAQFDTLKDIESDFDNVCAAWNWAARRREAIAINGMIGPMINFSSVRGLAHMMDDLFRFAAEQFAIAPDEQQRACLGRILREHGCALADLGQFALAEDLTRKALAIVREFDDKTEIAWGLSDLSRVVREPEEANRLAEESIVLFTELDDKFGQALAHLFRGGGGGGLSHEGKDHLLQCLALSRENGYKAIIAWALSYLAYYYADRGQAADMHMSQQESLGLFRELNHRRGLSLMLTETAADAMDRGDLEGATHLMNEGLAINREVGEPSYLGWALTRSGILAEINGDDEEAHRLAQEAFALTEHSHRMNSENKHLVRQFLAWTYCVKSEFTTAAKHLASCLQGMMERRERANLISSLPAVMWVLAAHGQPERAVELFGLAVHTGAGEIKRWEVRPHWKSLLADLEAELGSERYQAAFERGKSLDLETTVAELISELADGG